MAEKKSATVAMSGAVTATTASPAPKAHASAGAGAGSSAGGTERAKYRTTRSIIQAGAGDTVKYGFQTESGDIIFGVRAVDNGGGFIKEVLPEERLPSHESPVQGSFVAEHDTRLVFVWDNSYSWLTNKSVVYTIDVLSAKAAARAEPVGVEPTREAVATLTSRRLELDGQLRESLAAHAAIEEQLKALMARRQTVADHVAATQAELSHTKGKEDAMKQHLRGLLFDAMPPAVRQTIASFCPSIDLVRWRAVSSTFMASDDDATFWEALSMTRFGAFDHNDVFKGAEARLGAIAYQLFSIRAGQHALSGSLAHVLAQDDEDSACGSSEYEEVTEDEEETEYEDTDEEDGSEEDDAEEDDGADNEPAGL